MDKLTPEQAAQAMSDFVNTFSRESSKEFVRAMNTQHRTLQQSFTRLCMEWIENCASDEYRHDGRNEGAHNIAKLMVNGFLEHTGGNMPAAQGAPPSKWLPFV